MSTIEAREAAWKRHLEEQTAQYEHYDRNLSDKVSKPSARQLAESAGYPDDRPPAVEESVKKEKKEKKKKKEKEDKKEKKEKKEKKAEKEEKVTYLGGPPAPAKVTYLGAPPSSATPATAASPVAQDSASEGEAFGASPGAAGTAPPVAAACDDAAVSPASASRAPRIITRSLDLTWPDIITNARNLLLKGGRTSAEDLLRKWEIEFGYALSCPMFGIPDWAAMVRELQPGAVTIVDKKNCILQASAEAAFWKEQRSWNALADKDRAGTGLEWLLASLEKELAVVRKSLKERQGAQQQASKQADKIRLEYQALQANSKGQRNAMVRSTKDQLDKQEQKVAKFRQESEELERQERELKGRISKEQKDAAAAAEAANAAPTPQSADSAAPSADATTKSTVKMTYAEWQAAEDEDDGFM